MQQVYVVVALSALALVARAELPARAAGGCQRGQFHCDNGHCIIGPWKCDGDDDCGDGSDETTLLCRASGERTCPAGSFKCANSTSLSCIPDSWHCDGMNDCPSGEDELNCSRACGPGRFTCTSGGCIDARLTCDGDDDCTDGSDEVVCPERTCNPSVYHTCASGQCVARSARCDGRRDCADGSDEDQSCAASPSPTPTTCATGPEVHLCADGVTCIHHTWLCDGEDDCPDGSDENTPRCGSRSCRDDQFKCGGLGECIPASQRCSGTVDCRDGSDESNCTLVAACDRTQLSCANGSCVPLQLACDGTDDCGDGSDEGGLCARRECFRANGGCSHGCRERPVGRLCYCPPGFRLGTDAVTCEDVDECAIPGSCSQICINQVGHFKCECRPGYVRDPADHTFCKAQEVAASLLLAYRTEIRKIGVYHDEITSAVTNLSDVISVDFEYRTGLLYWSDRSRQTISSAPIDGGSRPMTLFSGVRSYGVAVDWLYGRLYWTAVWHDASGIEVADIAGTFRTRLVSGDVLRPCSIALDPEQGWMYWSDVGADRPRLERAGMDGTHRQVIVDTRIEKPMGITIDLVQRRIFWVDNKLGMIESADMDGDNRRLVVSSAQVIRRPLGIATFEDSVFWSDWGNHGVLKANKFTGEDVALVPLTNALAISPTAICAYHPYRQPNATNHCLLANGLCSHVCLPAPAVWSGSPRTSCACPAGLTLAADSRTCRPTVASTAAPAALPRDAPDPMATPRPGEAVRSAVPVQPDHTAAGLIVAAVVVLVVIAALLGFALYRRGLTKQFCSVQFRNPDFGHSTARNAVTLEDKTRRPFLPILDDRESLIADQREDV